MQNPFEDLETLNFSKFLEEQFKDKKSGEVFYIKTDKYKKPLSVLRATLTYVFKGKITTKIDKTEKNILWVKML